MSVIPDCHTCTIKHSKGYKGIGEQFPHGPWPLRQPWSRLLLKFAISPVIAVVSVIAYPARLPGQV